MGIQLTANRPSTRGIGELMAKGLISGRVDEDVIERAAFYIERAGLTTSDVIRVVWNNIATTGEIPKATEIGEGNNTELWKRFLDLRARTPNTKHLIELTPEKLKEELANREM